jgi:hypothetical protein
MNVAHPDHKYTLSRAEDYGELKRHRWEFQRQTSFAYGILTADGSQELACVYVNPSKKQGYDATVRILMTQQGENEDLQLLLLSKVKDWVKASWPFKNVAWPGIEITTQAWNALPDAGR